MKVILSATASDQLQSLFDYLEHNWSPEVRRQFQRKLDLKIKTIKLLPLAFPKSNLFPDCHKCVVSPQTSVIYRLKIDVIEVVVVLDNRQKN